MKSGETLQRHQLSLRSSHAEAAMRSGCTSTTPSCKIESTSRCKCHPHKNLLTGCLGFSSKGCFEGPDFRLYPIWRDKWPGSSSSSSMYSSSRQVGVEKHLTGMTFFPIWGAKYLSQFWVIWGYINHLLEVALIPCRKECFEVMRFRILKQNTLKLCICVNHSGYNSLSLSNSWGT